MVNQTQKTQMRDYMVDILRVNHTKAEPRSKQLIPGCGETDYILLGGDPREGAVLLVNRSYPKDNLNKIYKGISEHISNTGFVFFKDGKTFFRSSAAGEAVNGIKSKASKLRDDRSMKNYTLEDFHKMIAPRPEEKFAIRTKGWIQYYQPGSERLEEGIVSYKFKPVELDYSHIPSDERFGPLTKDSERTYIWTQKHDHCQNIFLGNGLIRDHGLISGK